MVDELLPVTVIDGGPYWAGELPSKEDILTAVGTAGKRWGVMGVYAKRGDEGERVKVLQEWLCLNDRRVSIDGEFGPATEAAVFDFAHETVVTGQHL